MPTKKKQPKSTEQRKPRRTYTEEEQLTYKNELRTGGRKGCKAQRINMAFAPDVLDYLRTMSGLRGESMTRYVDRVLRSNMEKNADLYQQAVALTKMLSSEAE